MEILTVYSLVRTELKVVRNGCLRATMSSMRTKWRTAAPDWLFLIQYFFITMYQKSHCHSNNPASLFQTYLPSYCSIILALPHIKDWKKLLQRIFWSIMESIQRLHLSSPLVFKLNLFNNVWSHNKEILVSNYYIFVPFIIHGMKFQWNYLRKFVRVRKVNYMYDIYPFPASAVVSHPLRWVLPLN